MKLTFHDRSIKFATFPAWSKLVVVSSLSTKGMGGKATNKNPVTFFVFYWRSWINVLYRNRKTNADRFRRRNLSALVFLIMYSYTDAIH